MTSNFIKVPNRNIFFNTEKITSFVFTHGSTPDLDNTVVHFTGDDSLTFYGEDARAVWNTLIYKSDDLRLPQLEVLRK